ncbi:F-box/kelch-repeat protein At1g80440-like [Phoenix dactylifera]|uniref:F-box/kelch-repeat protein At1g80440-like n=1 Tax=Phoenix dactylifera TaxID=42345 RepID=A0A8B7CYC1_PHODC|nr:F-box/kelch-repeat protein At1g80440-like [Phoenix dactylifera]
MQELIPGLPDEIARDCLLRVHYEAFRTVRSVCRLWKQELESPSFHRLRKSSGLSRPVVVLAQAEPPYSSGGPAQKYAASATPSYRLVLCSPTTATWDSLPPIPVLPHGLPLFCQIAAVGRELVVVGGWDPDTWAASDGVYVYNLESASWRRGARMPAPRRSFFACAASPDGDRRVFVAGGHDEEKNALKSAMAYDVERDAWDPLPDIARERDECKGVFLRGNYHVIGGYATEAQGLFGRSAEALDAASWNWGPVEEDVLEGSTCPRTCVAGGDGRLYVCRAAGQVAVREAAGGWRTVAEVPEDARVAPQLLAFDRELMVMGSACHGGAQACYMLDLNGKTTWRQVEVPPEYSGHVQASCCLEI